MVYGYAWELKCTAVTLDVTDAFDGIRGFHVFIFITFSAESAFDFFEDAPHL